jgi:hypothetical protein
LSVTDFPYAPLMTVLSATLLSLWSGWGLVRLTVPASLRWAVWWLTPLYGYLLNLLIGYWWFRGGAGLWYALATIVVLGGGLNLAAWRRRERAAGGRAAGSDAALAALLVISLAIGLAPQLHYGTPALIGGGWDVENYVPTAVYAQRGGLDDIGTQADNPLRDANADPARNGLTLGFSVMLGLVTLPIGQPALFGFTALLAWLRVLGLIAVFVTLRQLLQLRPWPAVAGTALTAAGSLLLWVSYFNFGMQLAAWPLLPLGLLLGAVTLPELAERGRAGWPIASGLVLTAAALPISYYPALGSLAGPALLLGLWLLRQSTQRMRLLTAAAAVGAAAAIAALPTIPDYFAGFSYRYSLPLTTLGIFRFISLEEIIGLSPYLFRGEAPLRDALIWGGLLVWGGLSISGLLRGPARAALAALLLGSALFLLQIRFGREYHYGYLKAAAYVGWIAAAAVAAGLQALSDRRQRAVRWAAVGLALAVIGQATWAQSRVVAVHWPRPGLYGDELPELLALRELVPAGATISFSGDPRPAGTANGLAALLLDHAQVWGQVATGYTASSAGPADQVGEYGLLQRDEEPTALGYAAPALAELGSYRLYRRRAELAALLTSERELTAGDRLTLSIGARTLAWDAAAAAPADGEPAAATVVLNLAVPQAATIVLNGVDYRLSAGLQRLSLPRAGSGGQLVIGVREGSLLLRSVELLTAAETQAIRPQSGVISSGRLSSTSDSAQVELELQQGAVSPLVAALDIWDRKNGRQYGWFGVQLIDGSRRLRFELAADGSITLSGAEQPAAGNRVTAADGTYTAALRIGTNRESLIRPRDLFSFTLSGGRVTAVEPLISDWLMAGQIAQPPQPLQISAGEYGRLLGISAGDAAWQAGRSEQVTLWWATRAAGSEASVLVQLFSESGERIVLADGPPAQGARPTSSWRDGELILDTRTLQLPPELDAGRYRLRIGLYRWPELTPVALRDDAGNDLGETIDITVEIKDEG